MVFNKGTIGLLFLALLQFPSLGFGWGALGHWTMARLAQSGLSPNTLQQVNSLLAERPLAYFSTTPDDWRYQQKWKFTSSYHFDTVPNGNTYLKTLSQMSDKQKSRGGVVLALIRSIEVLKQAKYTGHTPEVRNALIFLIHFVGDIHQPLHVGKPGDSGGNAVRLKWMGKDTSLHAIWDTNIILAGHEGLISGNEIVENSVRYAGLLAEKFNHAVSDELTQAQDAFSEDNIEAWIERQMEIRDALYIGYNKDQTAYTKNFIEVIDYQIYLSGVRLAQVLNTIFDPQFEQQKSELQIAIESILGKIENVIRLLPNAE